jgi:hypothetical protein
MTARALSVQEFEADFPDDELVLYRNEVLDVECLIAIPKAKLAERAAQGVEPFWRHGETMHVRRAEASNG